MRDGTRRQLGFAEAEPTAEDATDGYAHHSEADNETNRHGQVGNASACGQDVGCMPCYSVCGDKESPHAMLVRV